MFKKINMNQNNYVPEKDYLAIGLTKSPMFMGVNIRMFFSNVIICALLCINTHTFLGIPLFILIHALMVKFSLKEPNFLYIFLKSILKTPPVLNYWFWGKINSYEPW